MRQGRVVYTMYKVMTSENGESSTTNCGEVRRRRAPRPGVKSGRERQTTIMTVTDCVEMGIENAAKQALEVAFDGVDAVWLSFDVDCLDAAFVPGTGWPEPGGFLPREVLKFLQIHRGYEATGRDGDRGMFTALRRGGDHQPHGHQSDL
jgi:arginase family enzyme